MISFSNTHVARIVLEKVAKLLGGFQTIIGVIAIVVGIIYFGLEGIVAIVAGLILAIGSIAKHTCHRKGLSEGC